MPSTCQCPRCSRFLSAPDELLGEEVQCPSCGHVFVARAVSQQGTSVGQPSSSSPAPAPPPLPGDEDRPYFGSHPPESERERQFLDDDEDDGYKAAPHRRLDTLPGGGKTRAATVFLGLSILSSLGGILISFLELQLINRAEAGQVNEPEIQSFEAMAFLAGIAQLVVYVGTIIAFCMWIYQAHKNLRDLDVRRLNFSPGWAVGWFFIPFMNLFKPYQVAQEIWKASDPHVPAHDPHAWKEAPRSGLIGLWWACWLVGNIIGNVAFRASLNSNPTLEQARLAAMAGIFSDAVLILAALCVMGVIQFIHQRQQEKFARLAEVKDTEW
jgi:hypothetical protein